MRSAVSVVLSLLLLAAHAHAMEKLALPQIPDKTVLATERGIVCEGRTKCFGACARATSDVAAAGGGVIRCSACTYVTGAVRLKSKVGLHLEKGATLRFTNEPSDYPVVLTRFEGTECMNYSGLLSAR